MVEQGMANAIVLIVILLIFSLSIMWTVVFQLTNPSGYNALVDKMYDADPYYHDRIKA